MRDVRLDRLENETPDDVAAPVLAAAHVYQVGSTRGELARRFHVDAALIARTPELLIVSTNGVGYDTVDVKACTDAGVLVVNQAGGNREAVAEHALGMLLDAVEAHRRRPTRSMRRTHPDRPHRLSWATTCSARPSASSGSAMWAAASRELCHGLFAMRVLAYDPYLTAAECEARGTPPRSALDELLRDERLRLDQLPADGGDPRHDRRARNSR